MVEVLTGGSSGQNSFQLIQTGILVSYFFAVMPAHIQSKWSSAYLWS